MEHSGNLLAEMIATGGLSLDDVFARVRLRVNEKSSGVAVPWYASKISRPFLFTERGCQKECVSRFL
jgi:uncharacterized caspase-like protein